MAIVQNLYTGNGSTVLFPFSFPYLEEDHIFVSLNGTLTTAFTFSNANTVQFNTAPAVGVAIRIFRETPLDQPEAVIFAGSAIRASDLNKNNNQLLYVAQESNFEAESATTTANTALVNSTTAISTANGAVSTANTATTTAGNAVTTANNAVTTANSAVTTAGNAVTTANSAVTTAGNAVTTANTAVSTANAASAAVASAVIYQPVVDLTALGLLTPADGDFFELQDSTGADTDPDITGVPGGLVGAPGLTFRLRYDDPPQEFVFLGYFANDSETRYLKFSGGTMTGALVVPLASAATPSLTFTGDLNTGIFSPSADTLAFSEGGVERARIDSAGRVLVGTAATNRSVLLATNDSVVSNAGIEIFRAVPTSDPLNAGLVITVNPANNNGQSGLVLAKTNGNANGSFTAVQPGTLGSVVFAGADGSSLRPAAQITGVGGTPNSGIFPGSLPGQLAFSTTDVGDTTPTERMRIDSSGRLLVGTSTAIGNNNLESISTFGLYRFAGSNAGPFLNIGKSRSGTVGTNSVVLSGDDLGTIAFTGADGSSYVNAAWIRAEVDGTPGANDMPGRLVFSTTADGASSPTERMRITSAGAIDTSGELRITNTSPAIRLTESDGTATHSQTSLTRNSNQFSIQTRDSTATLVSSDYLIPADASGATDHIWRIANTEKLRLDSTGLQVNAGLSISSTGVTTPVTANGNVFSGTYTPTLTNVSNVTSSTATVCHYMRVGNVVTVGGQLSITATATNTDTQVRITLPIASTFSNARQLAGAGGAVNTGEYGESVVFGADTANNIAFLRGRPTVTNNQAYNFSFTYLVS